MKNKFRERILNPNGIPEESSNTPRGRGAGVRLIKKNQHGGAGIASQCSAVDAEVVEIAETFEKLEGLLERLTPEGQEKLGKLLRRAEGNSEDDDDSIAVAAPGYSIARVRSLAKRIVSPAVLAEGSIRAARGRISGLERRLQTLPRAELIDYVETFAEYNGWEEPIGNYSSKKIVYRYEDPRGEIQRFAFYHTIRPVADTNGIQSYTLGVENSAGYLDDYGSGYHSVELRFRNTDNPNNLRVTRRRSLFSPETNKLNLQMANLLELIVENQGKILIDLAV
jgi:hypothetical protein